MKSLAWHVSASLFAVAALPFQIHAAEPPKGPPPGEHHPGPPPESIEACAAKSAGDACSFTGRENETVKGQCAAPPVPPDAAARSNRDTSPPLGCRPERKGPREEAGRERPKPE